MKLKKSKRRRSKQSRRKPSPGMTLEEFFDRFSDNHTAERWFEQVRWGDDFVDWHCPRCGGMDKLRVNKRRQPLPYWCGHCRRHFSVRINTVMQGSKLDYRKWAIAIYVLITNPKGVSSVQMYEKLGITQRSAWYLDHRIREAFAQKRKRYAGPVEVDETYIGGKGNKGNKSGRGPVGKLIVVGMRDRKTTQIQAKVIPNTKRKTLQRFVLDRIATATRVYTDQHAGYVGLPNHQSVAHRREFRRGDVHTNGIEGFWSMLKRMNVTYYPISGKHLQRYVNEAAGRNNIRHLSVEEQMKLMFRGMIGKRLRYRELTGRKRRRRKR